MTGLKLCVRENQQKLRRVFMKIMGENYGKANHRR